MESTKKEQLQDKQMDATKCMSSKNIQVHHKYYVDGRMAWEYPIEHCLITLCKDCHQLEHDKVHERQPTRHIREIIIYMIQGIKNYI